MDDATAKLWATQDRHVGDRERLFRAVADALDVDTVLYPGSYVDIAPSMIFDHVTYVDNDKGFPKFFSDQAGVREIISAQRDDDNFDVNPIHADYTTDLPIKDEAVDLLISLYAGFVSEHCTRYLKVGGTLLVNDSHGDASMASIDERYEFTGVITSRDSHYRFGAATLGGYFIPKRDEPITVERVRDLGRTIGYTKSAFAYLFTRTN